MCTNFTPGRLNLLVSSKSEPTLTTVTVAVITAHGGEELEKKERYAPPPQIEMRIVAAGGQEFTPIPIAVSEGDSLEEETTATP